MPASDQGIRIESIFSVPCIMLQANANKSYEIAEVAVPIPALANRGYGISYYTVFLVSLARLCQGSLASETGILPCTSTRANTF